VTQKIQIRLGMAISIVLLLLILPNIASPATVTRVDRAIHDGFELLIIHCDSLPEFTLEYDRVAGVTELRLRRGKISRKAGQTLMRLAAGVTIRGATADLARGQIKFRTPKPVVIREYLISGPSALILDFGVAENVNEPLPFELDREGYLKLGSSAERSGRLEIALSYVEHVRGWEGSDLSLTHRAGVIEQRLGRWDQALETLGESAQIAEFAADAHARRTMIFLAKGDTASMGEEWAGYFHADPKKSKVVPEVVAEIVDTALVVSEPAPSPTPKTPQITAFKLPQILSAGGGNSVDYLYYGWGFLAVGFLSLIGLLLSAKKNALSNESYGSVDISVTERRDERPQSRPIKQAQPHPVQPERGMEQRHSAESFQSAIEQSQSPQPVLRTLAERQPPREDYFDQLPMQNASQNPNRKPVSQRLDRVPVDEIVSLAEGGMSEREIAHQLLVGRDEVAMVLNLSRLARRSSPVNNQQ